MELKKICLIVVVDDEVQVEEYVQLVLRRRGYETASFDDPSLALEFVFANSENIDLVVSDIAMPQIDGFELARRVREISEDIVVVLLSGYSEKLIDAASLPNVKAVLDKPVLKTDLVQAVEGAIQSCTRRKEARQ